MGGDVPQNSTTPANKRFTLAIKYFHLNLSIFYIKKTEHVDFMSIEENLVACVMGFSRYPVLYSKLWHTCVRQT
jgi:hypothetical protein